MPDNLLEIVIMFIEISFADTSNNDDSLAIKHWITSVNLWNFYLSRPLSSKNLSCATKLVLSGVEALLLFRTDAITLVVFGRTNLREIYGLVRVGDNFHTRTNNGLCELLNCMRINTQLSHWLRLVARINENYPGDLDYVCALSTLPIKGGKSEAKASRRKC